MTLDIQNQTSYMSLTGDHTFYIEAAIKGGLPYQNSTVIIYAFENKDKAVPMDIRIKWFRVVADRNYEINECEDNNTFIFSAADVGCTIRVAIKAKDVRGQGMATISFGPIQMHPEAKKEVHHLLLNSAEICNFRLLKYNGIYIEDGKSFENLIKFNGEKMTFKFDDPKREDFTLDLKGTDGLQIKHSVKNDRDLTIMFTDGWQQVNETNFL